MLWSGGGGSPISIAERLNANAFSNTAAARPEVRPCHLAAGKPPPFFERVAFEIPHRQECLCYAGACSDKITTSSKNVESCSGFIAADEHTSPQAVPSSREENFEKGF